MTGFGSTETAPFALSTGRDGAFSGLLGLPAPGLELKLAPVGSKMEARGRGPSITPGYWRQDELTRAAFDEEGFYRLGDAMRFVDPRRSAQGTAVRWKAGGGFQALERHLGQRGPAPRQDPGSRRRLRAFDAVIAAPDREAVCALIFPNARVCRELAADSESPMRHVLDHPAVRATFQTMLNRIARGSTGGSTLVVRAILLDEPPSIDAREITDKGSINQKAVLENRSALVEELYAASVSVPHSCRQCRPRKHESTKLEPVRLSVFRLLRWCPSP